MNIPQELLDYLLTLISPPDQKAIYVESLDLWEIGKREDNSCPGIIIYGQPTPEQAVDLERVLMPGAHLLLIAPEEEPTGHTGTCRIEDAGFEIRDSILWVREAGNFYYVPKASRSERDAGCEKLTSDTVKNNHPTVKPAKIMEHLLENVPTDNGPIMDPFMGSGSTGIACLQTGHDFIGVEKESDYIAIATSRIQHWSQKQGYVSREIESDYNPKTEDEEPIDLF